jgi:uncharacterized protein
VRVQIDLSRVEGEPLRFAEELTLDPEDVDPDRVVGPVEVRLEGLVVRSASGSSASGRCDARTQLACTRCLEPVEWATSDRFEVELRPSEDAPADEDVALDETELDVIFLDDEVLDTHHLAAEQVLLALPMRIVCREQCAGLCPRCGADLNQAACTCEPEVDPRWQALEGLSGSDS